MKVSMKHLGKLALNHGVVHSLAFAHAEDLKNDFVETTRSGYAFAQDTSSYSLIATVEHVKSRDRQCGSIVTISYLGTQRVLDGYNVMGVAKAALQPVESFINLGKENIRVNAMSTGAIRTLSAKGIASLDTVDSIRRKRSIKTQRTHKKK